jgi:hypothetical protein
VSGRRGRRRGRSYQPVPERRTNWAARLLIVFIAFVMVAGFAILTFSR